MKEPHYAMIIQWDEDDKIFVVSVPEPPGCMTHGKLMKMQQNKEKKLLRAGCKLLIILAGPFLNCEWQLERIIKKTATKLYLSQ